jgi:urease accessory protein
MLITEKIGNVNFFTLNNRKMDYLMLEWHETNQRILHKQTVGGRDLVIEFANDNQSLAEGDIIYEDDFVIIVIELKECDAIVLRPKSMLEMGRICNEIGIRQLPLFYQADEILVAFDASLFQSFSSAGYDLIRGKIKLTTPLTKSNRNFD